MVLARNYGSTALTTGGSTGAYAQGDLNGDGKVDFTDLVILARNYGSTLLTTGGHALSATTTAAAVNAAALRPMVDFNELTNLMLKSRRRLLSDSGR